MDKINDDGHRPGLDTSVVTPGARPPPYPPDVRAKGWRFELDYEKIEQSDTWGLASEVSMAQPALLMMWMMAWTQVPCGSMPNDENLIRVRCRIPAKLWPALRPILMRGWWLAEDGRLYHDTLAMRVHEMLEYRRKTAKRVADHAARTKQSRGANASVTLDDTVANALVTREYPVSNDTGTGTGTGTINTPPYPPQAGGGGGGDSAEPTKTEAICKAIQAKGVIDADPGDPKLQAYVDKGVRVETFEAAAITTAKAGKGLSYLLGILKRQMGEAAQVTHGPDAPTEAWDATRSTIEARGVALGIGRWNDKDLSANRETFGAYTERVRRAIETGEVTA